jgi:lipid II:glycine glycyltransferase (peptidoglycan interpeptide bridge formation enzyme)
LGQQDFMAGFLALHPHTREPIAAVILLLGMHKEATYWAVGQDYIHRNLRATDYLVWHCLQFLKDKGYTMFDLVGLPEGNSSRVEGIRHFKTAWAGTNGRKEGSFVITHSRFKWLNPTITLAILNYTRKVANFVIGGFRNK